MDLCAGLCADLFVDLPSNCTAVIFVDLCPGMCAELCQDMCVDGGTGMVDMHV